VPCCAGCGLLSIQPTSELLLISIACMQQQQTQCIKKISTDECVFVVSCRPSSTSHETAMSCGIRGKEGISNVLIKHACVLFTSNMTNTQRRHYS
jgi:hypothetical protein